MAVAAAERGITVERQHIGMGPMGTSVFLTAHNLGRGEFEDLHHGGVVTINRKAESVGSGQFNNLSISANSDPIALVRHVPTSPPFGGSKEARALRDVLEGREEDEFCNTELLTSYYRTVGVDHARYLEERGDGSKALEANIASVVFDSHAGTFTSVDSNGIARVQSRELVLATGGKEVVHPDLLQYGDKVSLSREWIVKDKETPRKKLLEAKEKGLNQIVILGNGNSGASVIGELTSLPESEGMGIILAYRTKFYPFYDSLELAEKDGYKPDQEELSENYPHHVNRARGIRPYSQGILHQAQSGELGSVLFVQFDGDLNNFELLKNAGLIIQCFGYESNGPQLVDTSGKPISLQEERGLQVVDAHDRLVTADGGVIENAYRVGNGAYQPENWKIPGLSIERAQKAGPINGIRAFQAPKGYGEKLAVELLDK